MNSTSLESCEDFSNDSRILGIESFREIYLPSISVIGFIGNILTLFVLRKMKDCFHRLLFALALCDLIVPLFCNHLLFLNLFKQNGNMNMVEIIANAIMEAGFAGSGWMTVTISFERFLGICHPMDFPAASRKARYFFLPVLFLIIIDFCLSAALLGLFGQIFHIFVFVFYPHILIQYIFPAALLLVLNTIILHSVIKINTGNCVEGRFMKIPSSASVLIIVVFVYILCWAPFYIIDFTFVFLQSQSGCQGPDGIWVDRFWVAVLRKFGGCAIITNSSINFIIYCFVGRSFRKQFISTFSVRSWCCFPSENRVENEESIEFKLRRESTARKLSGRQLMTSQLSRNISCDSTHV